MIQENRTFDNLFATFPGADGARSARRITASFLREADLESKISPNNGYRFWQPDWNNGKMNGFDLVRSARCRERTSTNTFDPTQISRIGISPAIRARRSPLSNSRQRKLYRPSRSHSRRHRINPKQSLIDFPTPQVAVGMRLRRPERYVADHRNAHRIPLQSRTISVPYLSHAARFARSERLFVAVLRAHGRPELRRKALERVRRDQAVRHGPEWATNDSQPETKVFTDIAAIRCRPSHG